MVGACARSSTVQVASDNATRSLARVPRVSRISRRHKTFLADINRPRNEIDPRYSIADSRRGSLREGSQGGERNRRRRGRGTAPVPFVFARTSDTRRRLSPRGIRPTARM